MGYRERFAVTGLYENKVYPTVAETLQTLKLQGYQLFLATAKPTIYARQILEHFELEQYFTGIYGSELNGDRTHKDELIAYILEQEQLQASQCLMVGDREYDVLGRDITASKRSRSNMVMARCKSWIMLHQKPVFSSFPSCRMWWLT